MEPLKSDRAILISEQNFCLLHGLVEVLKTILEKPGTILEIFHLGEFSSTADFPILGFSPIFIIGHTVATHTYSMHINSQNSTCIKVLIYKYNSGEEEKEYIFSNNMTFYDDIVTICYFVYMEMFSLDHQFANDLIVLMKQKYFIEDTNSLHSQTITLERIALSYPSVFYSILHYNNTRDFPLFKTLLFPNLSDVFFIPFIASIIPVLGSDYKTPLALLLAVSVVLDTENKPSYVLYQRILTLHFSEVYPNYLKLELCRHLGIVYLIENEYKYAPYFTDIRNNAIKLIESLKKNDPSLKYTLSKI